MRLPFDCGGVVHVLSGQKRVRGPRHDVIRKFKNVRTTFQNGRVRAYRINTIYNVFDTGKLCRVSSKKNKNKKIIANIRGDTARSSFPFEKHLSRLSFDRTYIVHVFLLVSTKLRPFFTTHSHGQWRPRLDRLRNTSRAGT